MEANTTKVAYRRNGKLFSCEPCRKGKLRCDHTSPTCGRCLRRGKATDCIYHPAPLTKPRELTRYSPYPRTRPHSDLVSPPVDGSALATTSEAGRASRVSAGDAVEDATATSARTSSPTHSQLVLQASTTEEGSAAVTRSTSSVPTPNHETLPAVSRTKTAAQANSVVYRASPIVSHHQTATDDQRFSNTVLSVATSESCLSYRDSKHGFLGPTAFTAVFTEHSESTGFEEIETGNDPVIPPVTMEKLQRGAGVLKLLKDMPLFRKFTQRWFDHYDGLIIFSPTFRLWYEGLWDHWGQLLAHGSHAQMLRLAELVFKNTNKPVRTTKNMSAYQWSESFTGGNLRWEVVGFVLSLVALVAINLSEWDTIFDDMGETYVSRSEFTDRTRKASETCLCFCYECEVLNDAYLTFMFQDLILVGCRKGEIHYASWQRMGEVVDTAVALGLHRGNYVDYETPFWLSQLRRKLFVMIYARDKFLSSFLGRPPRLSIRYCKVEMPLELTDDELFLEGPELEAALSKIDERGWSVMNAISRPRAERVYFLSALLREETLEIALGAEDDLDNKIDSVRSKLTKIYAQFPSSMQVSIDSMLGGAEPAIARCDRVLRHVNALYVVSTNIGLQLEEFLLQRAVVNRGRESTKTLIPISRKLLQNVLLVHSRRDFFKDFRGDIVWLLVSHGLPSAGVLAIELLKQEQTKRYDSDLPKSETIQDLSVFIAALATVGSDEGNYNICNQGRRALKRVLDQILAPSAPALQNTQGLFDDNLYFPTGNDADFLQWLDNIDWDKNFLPTQPTDDL